VQPAFTAERQNNLFVFVNGGYDEASNYATHEATLLAFKNNLFTSKDPKQVALFNAGGDGSPVVPLDYMGYVLRDDEGIVANRPTVISGARPATRAELDKFCGSLKDISPDKMTVVYGDHGSTAGISLWDDSTFTASDIHACYSNLPKDTLVRSIHLHCYGGSAIVDPNAVVPETLDAFKNYIDKNYSKNQCALSLGLQDEPSQYYGWSEGWKDSPWTKLLAAYPDLSLDELKKLLNEQSGLNPTSVSTTDYFLRDVGSFLCKSNPLGNPKQNTASEACPLQHSVDIAPHFESSELYKKLCVESDLISQIKHQTEILVQADRKDTDLQRIYRYWTVEYLKERWPKLYEEYARASHDVERLNIDLALALEGAKDVRQIRSDLIAARKGAAARFERMWREHWTGAPNREFEFYLMQHCTASWLTKNREKYPDFSKYFLGEGARFRFSIRDIKSEYQSAMAAAQRKRKELLAQRYLQQKEASAQFFSDPRLASVKAIYEGIQNCEKSRIH
jgi:hypothetical protein